MKNWWGSYKPVILSFLVFMFAVIVALYQFYGR